jgi:hypothetical protein
MGRTAERPLSRTLLSPHGDPVPVARSIACRTVPGRSTPRSKAAKFQTFRRDWNKRKNV